MPLQKSYDVTITEEGDAPKAAPVNKRTWLLKLIGIFLFWIVVLILCFICWPSSPYKASGRSEKLVQNSKDVESVNRWNGGTGGTSEDKSNEESTTVQNTPGDNKQPAGTNGTPGDQTNEDTTTVKNTLGNNKQPAGTNGTPGDQTNEDTTTVKNTLGNNKQPAGTNGTPEDQTNEDTTTVKNTLGDNKQPAGTNGSPEDQTNEDTTTVKNTLGNNKQPAGTNGTPGDQTNEDTTTVKNTLGNNKQPAGTNGTPEDQTNEDTTTVKNTLGDNKQPAGTNGSPEDQTNEDTTTVKNTLGNNKQPAGTNGSPEDQTNEDTTTVKNTLGNNKQPAGTNGTPEDQTNEDTTTVKNTLGNNKQPAGTNGSPEDQTNEDTTTVKNTLGNNKQPAGTNGTPEDQTNEDTTTVKNTLGNNKQPAGTNGSPEDQTNEDTTTVKNTLGNNKQPAGTIGTPGDQTNEDTTTVKNTLGNNKQPAGTNGSPEDQTNEDTTTVKNTLGDNKQPAGTKGTSETTTPSPTDDLQAGVDWSLGSQMASRMLFYMNHSADACEDFYEYACGGFEADRLVSENDLTKQAIQRIFDQADTDKSSDQPAEFLAYYHGCVTHYTRLTEADRIKLAKSAIGEVGKFQRLDEWKDEDFDFTTMLAKLLLRNSAPLFDITPDVAASTQNSCGDQADPAKFTLKLGPPELRIGLYETETENKCRDNQTLAMRNKTVNSEQLYNERSVCKNHVPDFLDSIQRALEAFDVSKEEIDDARFTVEFDLMAAFTKVYPAEGEIRRAYVSKEYKPMKIEELQTEVDESFLNWTRLLQTLTDSKVDMEQPLQVYFSDVIVKGFEALYDAQSRSLNNGLLGLYAHKIYYEFVVSPRDIETYCKRVATDHMGTHASSLYMSSFSTEELGDMTTAVTNMFDILKNTLESDLKEASWLNKGSDQPIIRKLHELSLAVPDASYYLGTAALNPEDSDIKGKLTGSFFNDTMMLQQNYRKSMYRRLNKSPSDGEQIWTHFALPYQTTGSSIYELNKIIIPYGAIDWVVVKNAKKMSADHLALATLGTRIAHQIAHHFDNTGIQYIASKRNQKPPAGLCGDDNAVQIYADYVDNYKSSADTEREIILPSSEQSVRYRMTDLSLNERLSAATGLRLAYDTLLRTSSNSTILLPWLSHQENNEQKQFFLAYAQMHCTKVPLTSSFVSLYETERLPSRLKIFAVASSNEDLARTFHCRSGSGGRSEDFPSFFPHLLTND